MEKQIYLENEQIKITGKWKTGELLAVADELRRVALDVEIDFSPQEPEQGKEK